MDNTITRKAFYFDSKNSSIFCWLYRGKENPDSITIICPPIGHKYMAAHRSLRYFSDSLACKNGLSIRLDYTNTGDSSDDKTESFSIKNAIDDIVTLVERLRQLHPTIPINAIGFFMGASILMLASQQVTFNDLVLWDPCIKGKRFIREIKVLSGILDKENIEDQKVEATGVYLTAKFNVELEKLDLIKPLDISCNRIMYLHKSEEKENNKLLNRLSNYSKFVDIEAYDGSDKMLTYPTDTAIPQKALDRICQYLSEKKEAADKNNLRKQMDALNSGLDKLCQNRILEGDGYAERCTAFGSGKSLFGIYSYALKESNLGDLVVFLNCGSEHHVGPHRMYTNFSRALAKQGISALRIDIEGIGDSISKGNNIENKAYSPVVLSDIKTILEGAKEQGYRRFLLAGICAGAYHSFLSTSKLQTCNIVGAVMINPLIFARDYENEAAQSLSVRSQGEISRYKSNFFSGEKWKKIFTGQIKLSYFIPIITNLISYKFKNMIKRLTSNKTNAVKESLLQIISLNRKINILSARSDAGFEILKSEARNVVKRSLKEGNLEVDLLEIADHGLSKQGMRDELMVELIKKIEQQFFRTT